MSMVMDLAEIDATHAALVGGKAAQLGELMRIGGVAVPPGFCVTTDAFGQLHAQDPVIGDLLDDLSRVGPSDRDAIRTCSADLRRAVEAAAVPREVEAALAALDERGAHAVRSSATAEDSPTASFAGQYDSYLGIVGPAAVLQHLRRVWASLFSERAVAYRLHHGLDHRTARMAVVVQRMVAPDAAGVLFTADPVTGDRRVCMVEAVRGLGEPLVSGAAAGDTYRVRDGEVLATTTADGHPVLTAAQVTALAQLGRRIEAHFGRPQDIEWCLAGDELAVVQSRPITTLFPIPASADDEPHVYVSVGHQQMMTDAMKPLGLSVFQLTALPPMHEAGGRLFVEVTQRVASPEGRASLLELFAKSDPLTTDALERALADGFVPLGADAPVEGMRVGGTPLIAADPEVVATQIERSRAAQAAAERIIRATTGPALFDAIRDDIQDLKRVVFHPDSRQVTMTGMEATWWLNEHLEAWLGERNAADALTQSVPGNITSEMGLALLDVADVIRPHAEVVALLERAGDDGFLDAMAELPGGREARDAIRAYFDAYGMRCVGEIDITRPRWAERPSTLLPALLGNIRNFEPGAAQRRFEQGRREAQEQAQQLLERLRALPDGARKAAEAEEMIERVRTFAGYREYPKYTIVSRYHLYRQALLAEADGLVAAGVLREAQDAFFLTFSELEDAVRTRAADDELIAERRQAFRSYEALTPPRVLRSDGVAIAGAHRRDDVPAGALAGLAVSGGTAEGRARVVSDLEDAAVEPGDILVTAHTDPSWSPLFVAVDGLVTEVGGLMTHGAVIAREYGLPAVVGVQDATRLIRDGQRIRVDGSAGFVEVLG